LQIYGHRGAAGEAPENTLGGFRHAWERGVRSFELDVQVAADDELVVIHDRTVNRTTTARGAVASMTAGELARLDARRKAPPWPRREGVPTLRDVLRAVPRAESWLIEVKAGKSAHEHQHIAGQLRQVLTQSRTARKAVVISGDRSFLAVARELLPNIARGYLGAGVGAIEIARELDCRHLIVNMLACTPALCLQAWRSDVAVSVWTVNDPVAIRAFHGMRVHGLITDYPSMAVPLLGQIEGASWLARLGGVTGGRAKR
jgi:glycerophosphoryl diester phosphodiesterase